MGTRAEGLKLGVLGGTFDPIHLGHLIIAEEARASLGLDRVLFVPAGVPWLKGNRAITPAVHRLEMVRLAIEDNPGFQRSPAEVDRPGPSYTVDTLEELHRSQGEALGLYFILGMDSLAELDRWKEPRRVLELCTLVVAPRPGTPAGDPLSALPAGLQGNAPRVVRLQGPAIGISGTEIRQRVARGLSIRYWVPQAVERYIQSHRLYRGAG